MEYAWGECFAFMLEPVTTRLLIMDTYLFPQRKAHRPLASEPPGMFAKTASRGEFLRHRVYE